MSMLRVARVCVCLVFRDAGRLSSVSEASSLETPLSSSASQHSLSTQQFRRCQGHNRRARVHVTCELSGEGGLAGPTLAHTLWMCWCWCWRRRSGCLSMLLPCAGRQQTAARGLVTMVLLLLIITLELELYHPML